MFLSLPRCLSSCCPFLLRNEPPHDEESFPLLPPLDLLPNTTPPLISEETFLQLLMSNKHHFRFIPTRFLAHKIVTHASTVFAELQQRATTEKQGVLLKASTVGYDTLPFSLLMQPPHGNTSAQLFVLFNRSSCARAGKGADKSVKLALNIMNPLPKEYPRWWVRISAASFPDPTSISYLLHGFGQLQRFSSLSGVMPTLGPTHRYQSHKRRPPKKCAYLAPYYNLNSLLHALTEALLSNEQKWSIALQLLKTLNALHAMQLLHKDIKPENILLHLPRDLPKEIRADITDFDFSLPLSSSEPPTDFEGGTLGYLPFEQMEAMQKTPSPPPSTDIPTLLKMDIYSLGLVLGELFLLSFTDVSTNKTLPLATSISSWSKDEAAQLSLLNQLPEPGLSCYEITQHWLVEPPAKSVEHLVWRMIHPNPTLRPTAEEALQLFSSCCSSFEKMSVL